MQNCDWLNVFSNVEFSLADTIADCEMDSLVSLVRLVIFLYCMLLALQVEAHWNVFKQTNSCQQKLLLISRGSKVLEWTGWEGGNQTVFH